MSVVEAVERDLQTLAQDDPVLAQSALAATALALARSIDDWGNSATSRSMCARTLLDTLEQLRALAPAKKEADAVNELADRRNRRRGMAAG